MTDAPTTRVSVIQRAQSGDPADLVRIYAPLIHGYARRLGVREHTADDILQQVMLMLLEKLPTWQYDPARSFRGWLRTIVKRRVLDRVRRRPPVTSLDADHDDRDDPKHDPVDPAAASADEVDEWYEQEFQRAVLLAALDRLRGELMPRTFDVFHRAAVRDEPPEQVAAALGVSRNQVAQYKRRGLARLREIVAELRAHEG